MDVNTELQILANEEQEARVEVEYEDLMNDIELLREQEFLAHAADLENFSPFDTVNS